MPIAEKYLADLTEDNTYHIYNSTNNRELLFRTDEDRYEFLGKFNQYLSPLLDTYAWCLLPNHFHWLVRVKSAEIISKMLSLKDPKELKKTELRYLQGIETVETLIESSFNRFFISYAMRFNRGYGRRGNLFHRPFKRIEVNRDTQFTQAVVYIHANPLKHKIVDNFMDYKWSSWKSIITDGPTQLLRQELWDWFGGKEAMIKTHLDLSAYYYESEIAIEGQDSHSS